MSTFNGEVTQRDPIGVTTTDYAQCGGTRIGNPPPARDVLRCTEDGVLRITEDSIFRRIE